MSTMRLNQHSYNFFNKYHVNEIIKCFYAQLFESEKYLNHHVQTYTIVIECMSKRFLINIFACRVCICGCLCVKQQTTPKFTGLMWLLSFFLEKSRRNNSVFTSVRRHRDFITGQSSDNGPGVESSQALNKA